MARNEYDITVKVSASEVRDMHDLLFNLIMCPQHEAEARSGNWRADLGAIVQMECGECSNLIQKKRQNVRQMWRKIAAEAEGVMPKYTVPKAWSSIFSTTRLDP